MEIEATRTATHHQFVISGELTEREYDQFNQQIYQVAESDTTHVLLDLEALQYISSSGLGTLVRLYNLLNEQGFKVLLLKARPNIRAVLEQTRMDQIFCLHDTLQMAIAGLR